MTVVAPALQDMSEEEGRRLVELERQVVKVMTKAGREAGAALLEILEKRLYRASHASFEAYCRDRFDGMSRSSAYRMIDLAKAANPLLELSPEAKAISRQYKKAVKRVAKRTTLDQPPAELDPEPTEMEPEPPPKPRRKRLDEFGPTKEPEPPQQVWAPRPAQPSQDHRTSARSQLNRIMAGIDGAEVADLVAVSTEGERMRIGRFAAAFAARDRAAAREEDVIDPKTCPHPANRMLGENRDVCGRCGAKKKAAR